MFAGLESGNGPFGVQPVRERDVHRLHVRILDKGVVGAVGFTFGAEIMLYNLGFSAGDVAGGEGDDRGSGMGLAWVDNGGVVDYCCAEDANSERVGIFDALGLICVDIVPVVVEVVEELTRDVLLAAEFISWFDSLPCRARPFLRSTWCLSFGIRC